MNGVHDMGGMHGMGMGTGAQEPVATTDWEKRVLGWRSRPASPPGTRHGTLRSSRWARRISQGDVLREVAPPNRAAVVERGLRTSEELARTTNGQPPAVRALPQAESPHALRGGVRRVWTITKGPRSRSVTCPPLNFHPRTKRACRATRAQGRRDHATTACNLPTSTRRAPQVQSQCYAVRSRARALGTDAGHARDLHRL